jgi:hypothetical protein
MASVALAKPDGSYLRTDAILDLGSPATVVPKGMWEILSIEWLSRDHLGLGGFGLGAGTPGRLGRVALHVLDDQQTSPRFEVPAFLLDDDSQPLILGVEGLLTRAALCCHAGRNEAYLEFD